MQFKLHIKSGYLQFLQLGILFLVPMNIVFLFIFVKDFIYLKKPLQINFLIFMIALLILFLIVWTIWRKATFSGKDFINLGIDKGMKFSGKKRLYSWKGIGRYSFIYSYWKDMYVAARIVVPLSIPLFEFRSSASNNMGLQQQSGQYIPSSFDFSKLASVYENTELSRIEIFSLVSGSYDIDDVVNIENGKVEIPETECFEINKVLKEFLTGEQYFRAAIRFNKYYLWMSIKGHPWEGERFRQKILKGFEIFQAMNTELKKKYPVRSWDNWDVRWDKKGNFFYLAPKEGKA